MYYYELQEYTHLQYTTVQHFNYSVLSTIQLTVHKNTFVFFSDKFVWHMLKIIVTDMKDAEGRKFTPNMQSSA